MNKKPAASHDVPPWRGPDPRPNDIKRRLTTEGHVGGCRWVLQLHISLVILIILTLDDLLMLLGENCCWSLLGPKGLRWSTLYSQGCASKGPYGPNLAPIFCSHLGLVNGQCLAKMTICPEKRSVCRSFWEDIFKNKWPAKKIYFYSIH